MELAPVLVTFQQHTDKLLTLINHVSHNVLIMSLSCQMELVLIVAVVLLLWFYKLLMIIICVWNLVLLVIFIIKMVLVFPVAICHGSKVLKMMLISAVNPAKLVNIFTT